MNDERDALIDRVVWALSPLPPLDARATGRILAAARLRRSPSRLRLAFDRVREAQLSVAAASFLAAAALVIGFVGRGAVTTLDDSLGTAASTAVPPSFITWSMMSVTSGCEELQTACFP